MLDQLNYLHELLVQTSYPLSSLFYGPSWGATLNFPFDYSLSINIPYGSFVWLDVSLYLGAFWLMLVYSNRSQTLSPATLGAVLRALSIRLVAALLFVNLILSFTVFGTDEISASLYFFGGLYSINLSSQIWKIFIGGIWLVWANFFTKGYPSGQAEIIVLSTLSLSFSITLVAVNNYILLFLVLEGISLLSYIMAAAGRQYGSVTAAVHYFIYGSLGSMLLLLGLAILYSNFRIMDMSVWAQVVEAGILNNAPTFENAPSLVASIFVILGLLTKFGAAPLHGWVIEVYANLSYHVMWFFSIFIKLVLGLLLFRIFHSLPVSGISEILGALSLVIGCLGALRQTEIKRLFAYGSIMHVGFLLVSDSLSFQVYLVGYILSMALVGTAITNLRLNGQEVIYLSDVSKALSVSSPILLYALIVGLLSVSGVPPLAGFWGKFTVIGSILGSSFSLTLWSFLLMLVVVSVTLVAFFYYFRLVIWLCLSLETTTFVSINTIKPSGINTFLIMSSLLLFGFSYVMVNISDLLYLKI